MTADRLNLVQDVARTLLLDQSLQCSLVGVDIVLRAVFGISDNGKVARDGALHLDYRYFDDDWGIASHTLHTSWYQNIGARFQIVPNLRYYSQSAADFYLPIDNFILPPDLSQSSDLRLSAYGAATVGLKGIVQQPRWALTMSVDRYMGSEKYASVCYEQSDGLFDITSGVFRRVWHRRRTTLPRQSELDACLARVGWLKVEYSEKQIYLPLEGMELDFGGVVKEYVADATAIIARKAGIRHGLVNLGGDICIVGPQPDDEPWSILAPAGR